MGRHSWGEAFTKIALKFIGSYFVLQVWDGDAVERFLPTATCFVDSSAARDVRRRTYRAPERYAVHAAFAFHVLAWSSQSCVATSTSHPHVALLNSVWRHFSFTETENTRWVVYACRVFSMDYTLLYFYEPNPRPLMAKRSSIECHHRSCCCKTCVPAARHILALM